MREKKKLKKKINKQQALQERIKEQEKNLADVKSKIEVEEKKHQSLLNEQALQERIKEQEKNLTDVKSKIEVEVKKHQSLLNENGALKNEVQANQQVLDGLKREEEALMKKMDRFNDFLKDKADSLLSLDFINEDQYKEIFGESAMETNDDSLYVDFKKDLKSDFVKAVQHIQSYLVNKDIMYPQYVLADFFSLIQTNDLIILAGDSGSGKTNLVKSFADAVGGESKIIPVKPSWTSAEDLLGYYNPLQKKYLSTAFLDTIIEAQRSPEVPFFICLDEMNLARVEYYFSDFISKLEERDSPPEIELYSDNESEHVLSELSTVISAIESLRDKNSSGKLNSFYDLLKDKEVNAELRRVLGIGDKVSLVNYHSTLRRLLGGVLDIRPKIIIPENVRIIGAINIDETTHYLSPKVLDRAHVIKFDNPLLSDWNSIYEEVAESGIEKKDHKIRFSIDDFGKRTPYPKFDKDNEFCEKIIDITREYLNPLDVEIGLRTIRQGLNYQDTFAAFKYGESVTMNNFFLHKVFPKFTFDGNTKVNGKLKSNILVKFKEKISTLMPEEIRPIDGRSAITELQVMIDKSKSNDGIVNFWS